MNTLLSLFDGSGGFPLAATLCGIQPVAASEVEPYPIAVTRSRFPDMVHLGSVTEVNGSEIEPMDIVTFGSPCQDLSVAGKRAGLKHEENGDDETTRSGLFMEAIRIIKEMRRATNGEYPRFAVWENVPGAFSSNKGEDFRTVLDEFIKVVEPSAVMPAVPKNGWAYADSYIGDGWSIAYRVFDAQFWGVPQRRRRIYLVADFRGERAHEVLFEREGLRGYFETGGETWESTSDHAEGSPRADDRTGETDAVVYSFDSLASNSMKSKNPHSGCRQVEVAKTLDTTDPNPSKNQGGLAIVEIAQRKPKIINLNNGDVQSKHILDPKGIAPALYAGECRGGGGEMYVMDQTVYCLQGNGIDRADTAGCNGKGVKEDVCYTLNTIDRPAVCYEETYQKVTGPLMANSHPGSYSGQDAYTDMLIVGKERPAIRYIVRRLTPTECARLQGFPDTWGHPDKKETLTDEEYQFWLDVRNTHAAINGKQIKDYTKEQMLTWYNKLHTDSAEYKMWGNGIALPCALYVMQGIAEVLEEEELPEYLR